MVWAQRAELTGAPAPAATAAGQVLPGLVIDVDACIVVCPSAKEQAAATFKSTFGYHPILAFLDNSGEFLAGLLRPGNAGANTAADHISVLDAALAQIPMCTGTASQSWSGPMARAAPRRSSPTSAVGAPRVCAPNSRSAGRSPIGNVRRSVGCRPGPGPMPSTPTAGPARAPPLPS